MTNLEIISVSLLVAERLVVGVVDIRQKHMVLSFISCQATCGVTRYAATRPTRQGKNWERSVITKNGKKASWKH